MTPQPDPNQSSANRANRSYLLFNAILGIAPTAMKRDVEEFSVTTTPPAETRNGGRKFVGAAVFVLLIAAAAVAGALSGLVFVYSTDLPQVTELEQFRPSTITQLYDDQDRVIGQFALQRRVIDTYNDFPKVLRDALISTEDKEFEQHWGVDVWRVFGAAWRDVLLDNRAQGASTLTMQLSRNLFLSPDRNFRRKMQEVMLAIQIERRFTKSKSLPCTRTRFTSGTAFTASRQARTSTSTRKPKTSLWKKPRYWPDFPKRRTLIRRSTIPSARCAAATW